MSSHPPAPVVVLGAGPAGLSAALWLQRYELSPVVVDPGTPGGNQALSPYSNVTLLGHVGSTAREIAARFRGHLASEGVEVVRARCSGVERGATVDDLLRVHVEGRAPIDARALILATGTRLVELDVPGAAAATAARRLRLIAPDPAYDDARGVPVVVVGGGDNALWVAAQVAPLASSVVVVVRSTLRAHRAIREPVLADPRVRFVHGARVAAIEPDHVVLEGADGAVTREPAGLVYAALGFVPNSEDARRWLSVATDDAGYVLVDGDAKTSTPRVFAAGDVANPGHPCTATAIAYGTIAARGVERWLDRGAAAWELASPAFLLTGERRRRAR